MLPPQNNYRVTSQTTDQITHNVRQEEMAHHIDVILRQNQEINRQLLQISKQLAQIEKNTATHNQ